MNPVHRRLAHIGAGSALPLAALWLPMPWVLGAAAWWVASMLLLEVTRLRRPWVNRWVVTLLGSLLKPGEEQRVLGWTYHCIAILLALLLLERWAAVAALLFLAWGDPAAAVVGARWPVGRVGRKALSGSGAMFVVAALVALALAGWGDAPGLGVLLVGAAIAALVEVLPVPLDDNLTVPLVSGAVMMALV